MYVSVIAFNGPDTVEIQIEKVGIHETIEEAEQAIENFIEDVLEIERPGFKDLVSKILKI